MKFCAEIARDMIALLLTAIVDRLNGMEKNICYKGRREITAS